MRAGRLRHYLEVQTPTESYGATGQRIPDTYESVGFIWGEISTLSARELEYAEQNVPRASVSVRVREDDRIAAGVRLIESEKGRTLNVEGFFDPTDRSATLVVLCSEDLGK